MDTRYETEAGAWLNRRGEARESHCWAMMVIALEANPVTAATLSEVFQTWTFAQGLPAEGDALELLMSDLPTREQRVWLTAFVARWEAAETHPDFWSS